MCVWGNICVETASGGPLLNLIIEETYSIMKQQGSLLTPSLPPAFTPPISRGHRGGASLSTEGSCVMAGSSFVTHHLFTHTIGLHLARARSKTCGSLGEKKRACDLIGSVSASHRPLSHSCPLGVSIETETGSTVGAESMTKDREDPHGK